MPHFRWAVHESVKAILHRSWAPFRCSYVVQQYGMVRVELLSNDVMQTENEVKLMLLDKEDKQWLLNAI